MPRLYFWGRPRPRQEGPTDRVERTCFFPWTQDGSLRGTGARGVLGAGRGGVGAKEGWRYSRTDARDRTGRTHRWDEILRMVEMLLLPKPHPSRTIPGSVPASSRVPFGMLHRAHIKRTKVRGVRQSAATGFSFSGSCMVLCGPWCGTPLHPEETADRRRPNGFSPRTLSDFCSFGVPVVSREPALATGPLVNHPLSSFYTREEAELYRERKKECRRCASRRQERMKGLKSPFN